MEPGHEDREYTAFDTDIIVCIKSQWSPVMKTGNTRPRTGCSGTPTRLNGARS